MGACIDTTLKKKKPMATSMKKKPSHIQNKKPVKEPPKFKQITEQQLLYQYSIDDLVPQATTLEGPKYIINRVTGQVKILRLFTNPRGLTYDGLINFKNLTNSELSKLDNDLYVMVSQLLTGPTVFQYLVQHPGQQCSQFLKTIFSMIISIHESKIFHGGLTFDSFRFVSNTTKQIMLSQLNFSESEDCFGSLHINSQSADWQFFGILMYTITEGKLPYFSKQINQYRNISNPFIQNLLQGRPTNIDWSKGFKVASGLKKVLTAYNLRILLYKIIKLRGKRHRLSIDLYDQNTMSNMNSSRPMQDQMNKYEKNRLINKLKDLLPILQLSSRQQYLKLTIGGVKLNQYEVLFTINPQKRYDELIYRLSNSLN